MTKAVYLAREDGDYDFVAAFEGEHLPDAPSDWPQEICDWLNSSGEDAIIIEGMDLSKLPDVWVRHSAGMPNAEFRSDDGSRAPKDTKGKYEPRN